MKKLIPLLLCLFSFESLAARQFDIEVIFFKRAVDPETINESWPNQNPEINLERTFSFQDSEGMRLKGAALLPRSSYQLNAQYNALKKHAAFTPLMHVAWRQGDRGSHSAPVFRINAGKDYSKQFDETGRARAENQLVADLGDGITEETTYKPNYELEGKLQVYVQHYLFADVKLDLKKPSVRDITFEEKSLDLADTEGDDTIQVGNLESVSPTLQVEEFLKSYRMDQKRRMRSSETHYLDHPLMGMIIQVRRVQS
ncbi:conserved hypothetical protein [Vibrio nigripulchritudo MADA3029]|uniref:Peptidoglycan-binding protein CsiV n=2 Tax=Vibrio nigripulchritudo TaxID=28173 RepID=A0AAV2VH93_9VIBR|nr:MULTISPECIES: peptidoglycan binding protein CsiV [Vibrio]KJY80684.1 hypothetical protein TW74_03735 [Vibrio nigripulchritudo]UAB71544.1 peptidoglycan binding protein CsiV [Vibrio sp. SCSIO 43132]CCN35019.1 conserved hypothetical protein [Vibrio nigripulchritudo AM115]CCN39693.1 conserved hypothetical protein [Vibrio nigripulchritudo FTn2]CCN49330.1 conserved hypothetical protein [Vibrio nigripulchritudo MADA3020]